MLPTNCAPEGACTTAFNDPRPPLSEVPAEYRPLVINVIGPHPQEPWRAGEFRKAYALKHGAAGDERADWTELKSYGVSRHRVNECYSIDGDPLADLRDLLALLAERPTLAICLGCLRDDKRSERDGDGYLVAARDGRHYEDGLTRLMPVDIDELGCDDVHEAGDAIKDLISQHMPELEGCAYAWHHTGSSGINGVRVRLWFLLAEPRHLAAMRAYAVQVNDRAGRIVVDPAIYQAARLIFTSAPSLTASDGKQLPARAPAGVWLVAGDMVPTEAFADVLPDAVAVSGASAHGRPASEKLTKVAAGELLGRMGPGNYDVPIHRWLCSAAWSTADSRSEFDFDVAVATIEQRVRETSEPAELDRRLREHVDVRKLKQKWHNARDRKRRTFAEMGSATVADDLLPSIGALRIHTTDAGYLEDLTPDQRADLRSDREHDDEPMPIAAVRTKLARDFSANVDGVLLHHEHGHALIRLPAGAGKTKALEYLARPGTLSSNRVHVCVPNHRLAVQMVEDFKAAARAHGADPRVYGDLPSRIRHHKGRSQPGMCDDDVSRPKAERAEKLGVSVKKTVCASCKSRDVCPWLKQAEDNDCGIIVETHAAALTERSRQDADLVIIDESIAANFVDSDETTLAALANIGTIRSSAALGGVSLTTSDLRACRKNLVAALLTVVPSEADRPTSFPTAGWQQFDFDGTIALESTLREGLATQIINREDAGKGAADLRAQFAASKHAAALYGAIAASVAAGRQDVFGVAVYSAKNDTTMPLVRYAVRVSDATRVFGKASITLDGTANEGVWRAVTSPDGKALPGRVLAANIAVPDVVRVFQYADKAGSRSSLMPDLSETSAEKNRKTTRDALACARHWARELLGGDAYDADLAKSEQEVAADDAARAARKQRSDANIDLIERAAAFLAADAGRAVDVDGKRVSALLVAQKAVAEHLQPRVPGDVAVEHFGVLRGLNAYSKVPVAVIVGRVRPANIDLELMTEALHSRNPAVQTITRYEVAPAEGRPWLEQHPDALVAALQSQITTAGVQQAVARVRVYDRSPADPVDIHVFGQCDVGLPAAHVRRLGWDDAKRTPVEIALARGCVFADMRLNQRAYSGLFPKGNKRGNGRVDLESRSVFDQLLGNLARQAEPAREIALDPYREVGSADLRPLLAIESNFAMGAETRGHGDALDYSPDGAERGRARRHKLVRLRIPGAGSGGRGSYASYAIVDASWNEADVAQLVGAPVETSIEQTAEQLQALAARRVVGRSDGR